MEFTFDDVETMLKGAMKSGKRPRRGQIEQLRLMTNMLSASVEATREMRAAIAARDAVVSALGTYHRHLAACGVDVAGIDAVFGQFLDGMHQLDPILADREGAAATIDDCGLGEIPLLAESLALACRMAFAPGHGDSTPSLKSDSAATRYAGIVIEKLTGKKTSGSAVKQHHLRLEECRRTSGTKA